MSVSAAIRKLERIGLIQQAYRKYRLNYAVTVTQKEILKAFGINEVNIRKWVYDVYVSKPESYE